nr:immunoglobulin heavy chain junction region [Macaca mulatta]MOW48893.1 immunoglobulin heavy chain junction region [Macaca mulatta]
CARDSWGYSFFDFW